MWLNVGDSACVDEETEILTKRGWLGVDEVVVGDEAVTLNPETRESEWGPIEDLHVYEAMERPMLRLQGVRGHSSMTTLNHRWLVERRTTRSGIGTSRPGEQNGSAKLSEMDVATFKGEYDKGSRQVDLADKYGVTQTTISKIVTSRTWAQQRQAEKAPLRDAHGLLVREWVADTVTSDALLSVECRVPVCAAMSDTAVVKKHNDELVELVAWYWTEGNDRSNYGGARGIWITQSPRVYDEYCSRIRSCMARFFGPPVERLKGRSRGGAEVCPQWREERREDGATVWKLNGAAADKIRQHAPSKVVCMDFLLSLTQQQLDLFVDVSMMADGTLTSQGGALVQSNQSDNSKQARCRAEAFQIAALLSGRYATLNKIRRSADPRPDRNGIAHDGWSVTLGSKKFFKPSRCDAEVVSHHGVVWCPSTPNGSWLARRNGTPFFTGNSGSGGSGGDYNKGGSKDGKSRWRQGKSGYQKMTWCNVPPKLVEAMIGPPVGDQPWWVTAMFGDDARFCDDIWPHRRWLLRQTIVWDKGVERPESVYHARRPRPQHEFIYMLARDRSHRFYADNLEQTGTVWRFPPNRSGDKGLAPFPDELAVRCIMPSTVAGDVVLDPFAGSMTVPKCADELGRVGIGVDLYSD